jgi:hypothetical protein
MKALICRILTDVGIFGSFSALMRLMFFLLTTKHITKINAFEFGFLGKKIEYLNIEINSQIPESIGFGEFARFLLLKNRIRISP